MKSRNNIIMKKTDSLIPYARNNKKHPQEQIDLLAANIKEFGFNVPILLDSDNSIIAGHARLLAAKKLNLEALPCLIIDDLTPPQIKALRIADNRLNEMAETDWEMLKLEFDELAGMGEDVSLTGYEDDDFADFMKEQEVGREIQEVSAEDVDEIQTDIQLGDCYQLGEHRVMCGDATKSVDVGLLMLDEKADMVFTDPPYGVSYADKNKFLNAIARGNRIQTKIKNDHMQVGDMKEFWIEAFKQLFNASRKGTVYYICSPQGGELMMMMMKSILDAGWLLKHCLIWVKNNHVLGRCDYSYKHEPLLYGWKEGGHKYYGGFQTSVWEVDKPHKSELHPTMKPIELCARAIKNSSKENNIVLDLFGGSGSTLIAAEQLNRRCRMMELDPRYVEVICRRWELLTGNKRIKLNG